MPPLHRRSAPLRACRAALLAVLLVARGASAAPSAAAPDAEAVAFFDEGRKLMGEKKFADAIPRFEESLRHARTVGALLNLGRCYEETGRAASAWATYRAAGALARELHDAREQVATEYVENVRARVSTLAIDARAIAGVEGAVVKSDGVEVGSTARGQAAPIDPGDHVIEASAPGKVAWRGTVRVKPNGDAATIAIPALADAPVAAETRSERPSDASTASPPSTTARTIGWIALGAGAVGVGVGSAAGLVALGKHHDATSACPSYPDHCPSSGAADAANSSSQSWATVSTIGFVAGGAALATGVILLLTAPKQGERPQSATRVAPMVIAHGGGVGIGGAW